MSNKLASLHAGLIARKGEAVPALTHPAFSYVDAPRPAPPPMLRDGDGFERRGFGSPAGQDFGPRAEASVLRPPAATPPPQPDEPARAASPEPLSPPAPEPAPAPVPEPVRIAPLAGSDVGDDHPRPYRITLRLTGDQRRRLRIAAAKEETTLQALLSQALDSHLDTLCACELRDCTCLAREDTH